MRARRRLLPLVVLLGVLAATTAGAPADTGSPVHWGDAIKVPGTDALNVGGYASVTSVSCAGAGECAALGLPPGGALHDPCRPGGHPAWT